MFEGSRSLTLFTYQSYTFNRIFFVIHRPCLAAWDTAEGGEVENNKIQIHCVIMIIYSPELQTSIVFHYRNIDISNKRQTENVAVTVVYILVLLLQTGTMWEIGQLHTEHYVVTQ